MSVTLPRAGRVARQFSKDLRAQGSHVDWDFWGHWVQFLPHRLLLDQQPPGEAIGEIPPRPFFSFPPVFSELVVPLISLGQQHFPGILCLQAGVGGETRDQL